MHEDAVRRTLEQRCVAGVAMQNEIVDRHRVRQGTKERHVELQEQREIRLRSSKDAWKFRMFAQRIMGDIRLNHSVRLPHAMNVSYGSNKKNISQPVLTQKKCLRQLSRIPRQPRARSGKPTIDHNRLHYGMIPP